MGRVPPARQLTGRDTGALAGPLTGWHTSGRAHGTTSGWRAVGGSFCSNFARGVRIECGRAAASDNWPGFYFFGRRVLLNR